MAMNIRRNTPPPMAPVSIAGRWFEPDLIGLFPEGDGAEASWIDGDGDREAVGEEDRLTGASLLNVGLLEGSADTGVGTRGEERGDKYM